MINQNKIKQNKKYNGPSVKGNKINLGRKWTDEQKKKLSESHKGQIPWFKGHNWGGCKKCKQYHQHSFAKHSSATKKKLSNYMKTALHSFKKGNQINKNRKQSGELKQRRSEWMKKLWRDPEYKKKHHEGMLGLQNTLGTKQSEETKAKRAQAMQKHFNSEEYKQKLREKRLLQVFPKKDSKIEKMIQVALQLEGIRFRTHEPIMGQPDIFIEPNVCVFVDGCYFHGCTKCYGAKILNQEIPSKSIERDQKVVSELQRQGYAIWRIWEHDITSDPNRTIQGIKQYLERFK